MFQKKKGLFFLSLLVRLVWTWEKSRQRRWCRW